MSQVSVSTCYNGLANQIRQNRARPFLNQPPPPSEQPQIVEVHPLYIYIYWWYILLDFSIPTKKAWGLGLTIRSTEIMIVSTEDLAKRWIYANKANHLCPKNLVGLTVCKRHRQDRPRTCDNRPRDSAARHQVWTQGLTAINLSNISPENIMMSPWKMEYGLLMIPWNEQKIAEHLFKVYLQQLIWFPSSKFWTYQNDNRVPDSHFESHSQAIAQNTACTTGGTDSKLVHVAPFCFIHLGPFGSIWIESHPTTWKFTSKPSLECLVSWATIAWRFEDLAWRDDRHGNPSLLLMEIQLTISMAAMKSDLNQWVAHGTCKELFRIFKYLPTCIQVWGRGCNLYLLSLVLKL